MVEIIFGDNRELACLEGKTVAEVRKEYEDEFGIPGRAQAELNGVMLKKKLETDTKLDEGDELRFVEKKRSRIPVLITAVLAALAITSGVFAYTQTTESVTIAVSGNASDFANLATENVSAMDYTVFGKFRGAISASNLFTISPNAAYPGDVEVTVYLSNVDELTQNYRFFTLRCVLVDTDNTSLYVDTDAIVQVLTLENGVVSFYYDSADIASYGDAYVRCLGGTFITYPGSAGWSKYDPVIYAQVSQGA